MSTLVACIADDKPVHAEPRKGINVADLLVLQLWLHMRVALT